MPDAVTISVAGLSDLGERMRKLTADVATKGARSAVAAAARVVKTAAVQKAPKYPKAHKVKDEVVQPGNLKRNIVIKRNTKSELTAEYFVTVRGKKKDGYAARYGRLVEFGTVIFAPEPFLRPAFSENQQRAVSVMADKLSKFLSKAGA